MDRAYEFWAPAPVFRGETVFLLASGPSLAQVDLEPLRGRAVIAVNSSAALARWAPVLFFTDPDWLFGDPEKGKPSHLDLVTTWPGAVMTFSRHAKAALPDRLLRIETMADVRIREGEAPVRHGVSTGHSVIGVAGALGAHRCVLLGYDMRLVDGRSHCHDEQRDTDEEKYRIHFALGWRGWAAACAEAGMEVVNVTPGSALTEFPMGSLEEELARPVSRWARDWTGVRIT